MDMTENTQNGVQEPAVEALTGAEPEAAQGTQQTAAENQKAQAQPQVQPQAQRREQPPEENQRYKQFRQQYEAQQRQLQQQLEQERARSGRVLEALKSYGMEGSPEEVALALEARAAGVTPEQLEAQRQQEQERARQLMESDPEVQNLRERAESAEQIVFDGIYKADAEAINRAFPDAKIRSIDELGDQFAALRANGVDAVTAYAAMKATAKPKPPVMGAVGAAAGEKTFYTSAEVDELTRNHPEMLDDPKIMERVMKSMTKWK